MPGALFSGENLRGLQYPIPCRDEIIPDPDSVPLSVLHYSTKERCRVDFSAYDPPEPTPPPAEGTHPVLVPLHSFSVRDLDETIDLGCTME